MLENHRSISVLCWGMVISFLGSLPLGTINIVATQIAVSRGQGAALLYSSGSLLVELLYVSIVLSIFFLPDRDQPGNHWRIRLLYSWRPISDSPFKRRTNDDQLDCRNHPAGYGHSFLV